MPNPRFRPSLVRLFASAVFLPAVAGSLAQTAPPRTQKPVLAAWTELVGDKHPAPYPQATGHTVVRVITSAATCPSAEADGQPLQLTVRQAASLAFPVTTCQATPRANAQHVTVAGVTLLTEPARLQRIIVIGDTGCRLKGPLVQDCNNVSRWPFPLVAAHAAAKDPDLVIHVGDYYYRESPCPAGAAGCAGSPHGDAWGAWAADIFDPAAPLLTAAPWIFVRGNHEQCGRGADGWFRILDAAPVPQSCKVNITALPFTVRLDGLTLNVMDSADTDDVTAPADLVAVWTKQLEQLGSATETGHGWILTHRPIWGLDPKVVTSPGKKETTGAIPAGVPPLLRGFNAVDYPSNRTEQVASDNRALAGTDMILSGHVHLFTALDFGPARPVQLVVGNGGDNPNVAVAGPEVRTETVDGMSANIFQLQRYGYFMMDRTKDGWIGTVFSVDDRILATCTLHERNVSCLLAPSLPPQLGPTASNSR
jgi:Calcineurin-like phosphoesterase